MVQSIHRLVIEAIKTKLEELTWPRLIAFEEVRLTSSEFKDHEIPAIQVYDIGDTATEQIQGRTENDFEIAIEIVMKRSSSDYIGQGDLFDRRLEVKRKLGEDPTLGLQNLDPSQGRFKHIKYNRCITDLHILKPYYVARLEFSALFEEPFSTEC